MKHLIILWTRPEIIKLYSLIVLLKAKWEDFCIVHTNQHYDKKMDEIFFDELEIPRPKYNLNIGSWSQHEMTGRMLIEIWKALEIESPDVVYVQWDTNTVMAWALVASKMGIKVAHIEAWLRSYDRTMPEEINRIVTDHISDYLFCPTNKQKDILLAEWIESFKIIVTGNTIVDAVFLWLRIAESKSYILKELDIVNDTYMLLTCHRPSNTDDDTALANILSAVNQISKDTDKIVIFPMHPRLNPKKKYILENYPRIKIIDPVWYLDMLMLQKNASMIFTVSGWIQEESCILQKKCLILRTNTERPETVEVGGAIILEKVSTENIYMKFNILLDKEIIWTNPFGDWTTSVKIFNAIQ